MMIRPKWIRMVLNLNFNCVPKFRKFPLLDYVFIEYVPLFHFDYVLEDPLTLL